MFDRHGGIGAPSSRQNEPVGDAGGTESLRTTLAVSVDGFIGLQWALGAAPTLAAPHGRIRPMEGREGPLWDAGIIDVAFTATGQFLNPAGDVQGGLLAAMLDDTMGPALVATRSDIVVATYPFHVQA